MNPDDERALQVRAYQKAEWDFRDMAQPYYDEIGRCHAIFGSIPERMIISPSGEVTTVFKPFPPTVQAYINQLEEMIRHARDIAFREYLERYPEQP